MKWFHEKFSNLKLNLIYNINIPNFLEQKKMEEERRKSEIWLKHKIFPINKNFEFKLKLYV